MMILHLILGKNIDTFKWKRYIENKYTGDIVCVDYELTQKTVLRGHIVYVSVEEVKDLITKYEKVRFYSSFYKYPLLNKEDI